MQPSSILFTPYEQKILLKKSQCNCAMGKKGFLSGIFKFSLLKINSAENKKL